MGRTRCFFLLLTAWIARTVLPAYVEQLIKLVDTGPVSVSWSCAQLCSKLPPCQREAETTASEQLAKSSVEH